MSRVLCVCSTTSKGKLQVEKINLEINSLENGKYSWVSKSLKTMKSPRGEPLEPCSWHSGTCHNGDINNPDLCYLEPLPSFGIWLTNYDVYDTCHLKEKELVKKNSDDVKLMDKLINELGIRSQKADELHSKVKADILKRTSLINEMSLLQKEMNKDINLNDPEYLKLCDIEKREKNAVVDRKISLTATYENMKNKDCTLSEFLSKYTVEDVNKYNKARDAVQNWFNQHSRKDKSILEKKYYNLKNEVNELTLLIERNFAQPFAYLYRTYLNILKIRDIMQRYKVIRLYTLNNIEEDINWHNTNLSLYNEFLKGANPREFMEKVEKEQAFLEANEKMLKSNNKIHVIEGKSKVKVIDVNGDCDEIYVDKRVIVGNINKTEEEVSSDRWSRLR